MAATDLSVCFLGCGSMNARHIRTLRRLRPGARVSVASRDAGRAQAFAGRVGAVAHFGSYEQLSPLGKRRRYRLFDQEFLDGSGEGRNRLLGHEHVQEIVAFARGRGRR